MTADEIREWHKTFEKQEVTAEVARARARIEIAAQLSELNTTLILFLNLFKGTVSENGGYIDVRTTQR